MCQCQKKNKRSLVNAKDKSSKIQIMYWKKKTLLRLDGQRQELRGLTFAPSIIDVQTRQIFKEFL